MNKKDLMTSFEEVTDQLLAIDLTSPSEQVIQLIEALIDKRENIIKQVDELEEESEVPVQDLNRMMQKNLQVETLLEEVMLSIKDGIKGVIQEKSLSSKKKKAHRGYLNTGHQNDGYFIDKKK